MRRGLRTADPDALPFLDQAAKAYRAALTFLSSGDIPTKWTRTQGNLGNVLLTTGRQVGGSAAIPVFRQAINPLNATLIVFSKSEAHGAWVFTQNNLAVAIEALANLGRSPRENLLIAESASAGALRVIDAEDLSTYRPMRACDGGATFPPLFARPQEADRLASGDDPPRSRLHNNGMSEHASVVEKPSPYRMSERDLSTCVDRLPPPR